MIRLRNYISAFWGLFLLAQCATKKKDNGELQMLASNEKQAENSLLGEWKYINSIWYSSELTLHDNGTFTFHDQGCYGQKFSLGQWTDNNGMIELTSFDSFKQKGRADIIKSTEDERQQKTKRKFGKGEVEYSIVSLKDISPPVMPGADDTIRIYLNKIQLQLRNDTLYCIGRDKLPEGAKFYRANNNR
ncbi:MAG: hypothetical protein QM687_12355 [Ferruginibacter sp.]